MQAVFFDLDGTLYNKKGLAKRIVVDALLRGRLSDGGPWRPISCLRLLMLERSERRKLAGVDTGTVGYDTLFEAISKRCAFSVDAVRTWYDGWYMKTMVSELKAHYRLDAEVMRKAEEFKAQGVKLAVLSDYGCVEPKLRAIGGSPEFFDALLDAPSLGGFKPASGVFRAACQVLGVDPAECEMFGDRPDTDGGCVSVGMKFVHIQR